MAQGIVESIRMSKPCNNCSTNIEQAIYQDEITCYQTCKKWLGWEKEKWMR